MHRWMAREVWHKELGKYLGAYTWRHDLSVVEKGKEGREVLLVYLWHHGLGQ